jgi:hypothetical protein
VDGAPIVTSEGGLKASPVAISSGMELVTSELICPESDKCRGDRHLHFYLRNASRSVVLVVAW